MSLNIIPADILEVFGFCAEECTIRVCDHPWGVPNAIKVEHQTKQSIFKKWAGANGLARMKKEARLLAILADVGFKNMAHLQKTKNADSWHIDSFGVGWTAYNFILGKSSDAANKNSGAQAGAVLASLHAYGSQSLSVLGAYTSRLHNLSGIATKMKNSQNVWDIGDCFAEHVVPCLSDMVFLPHSIIHGDYVLENILHNGDKSVLIDFEFSRPDVRLFDFAAAIAPKRNMDGTYQIATEEFLNGLASAYNACDRNAPITENELMLFPFVAASHFAFVYDDLTSIGSPHAKEAEKVLRFLAPRVAQKPSYRPRTLAQAIYRPL